PVTPPARKSSTPSESAKPGGLFDAVRPVEEPEDEFGSGLLEEETALPPESPVEETPALNAPVEVPETPTLAASATEPVAIPASQLKWFKDIAPQGVSATPPPAPVYEPKTATPKPLLDVLFTFRTIHPLYAMFLLKYMGQMDPTERIQTLESVLELSPSLLPFVRVPKPEILPPGQFATAWLNIELLQRGLATQEQLVQQEREDGPPKPWEERVWVLSFSDKLRLLFEAEHPGLREVRTLPVWVVGDLVQFGGDFTKYISGRDLSKQEGLIFRHCLRMVLLCGEFENVTPDGMDPAAWRAEMRGLADLLTNSCRSVDPESTDQLLENVAAADVVMGEEAVLPSSPG
ncbi:MAG TPA: hypothetical protein VM452_00550, partial [Caulifigura sp.]|nr:hypothetical protein [Caulifigura sp.]